RRRRLRARPEFARSDGLLRSSPRGVDSVKGLAGNWLSSDERARAQSARSKLFVSGRKESSGCERLRGVARLTASSLPKQPTPFARPALHRAPRPHPPAPSHNGAPPFARSRPRPSQFFDAQADKARVIFRPDVAADHLLRKSYALLG